MTQNYASLFRQRVLANAQYWQDYVTKRTTDVAALDRERDCILKAISFALDIDSLKIEAAWPYVYELMVTFASFMERRGYWESWQRLLNQALAVAQQLKDVTGATTLSALLARLLQRQSHPKQTIAQYRRTIRMARQTGNRFEEARACSNLGYLYIEQGYWYRAEVLCYHALDIFEQIDSNHGCAHTENHLGFLYAQQGLWDKAQQHLEHASAIWQSMGDNHGLIHAFTNLSGLYVKMKRSDEALFYAKKALQKAKITGEELEIGKIYNNMGLAYKSRGELSKAEVYSRRAEIIFQHFSNSQGLADVFQNLGVIYLEQRMWSEACWYLDKALKTWRTLNNKHDEIRTIIYLAQCELARGDQQGASIWLEEAEHQLSQHPQARRYYRLPSQINRIRRSLNEILARQAAAESQN